MRIAVIPASTNTGTAAIESLLSSSHPAVEVHAVYRNLAKVPADFAAYPNFHAVQGDVLEGSGLDLTGCDAVLAITPPAYESEDIVLHAKTVSQNVKDAIERSGSVKRLVLLSSGGAQHDTGVGEIKTNNMAERVFSTTDIPAITFVRCAYFMSNWTSNVESLKAPEPFFYTVVTPLDYGMPMIALDDIGSVLATELRKETAPPSKPYIFELHGPRRYTPLDVQSAFSKALNKDVAVKPIGPDQLQGFFAHVFPATIVDAMVEMTLSFLPGGLIDASAINYDEVNIVQGTTELETFIARAVAKKMPTS
ncbi:hypothetical protein HIM_05814 [Hirsutella minnesotensis 3608]|uniref:NAD(P)-binding domain-containing protein n=1 Tax=Hirsutella minnesotensis 3608 TaxID=1043627 RepID=A0A0F7ZZR8_9HYPO|nr:hypothetical protein HIM_05814 [Hirsutella minnesotensis 3608]